MSRRVTEETIIRAYWDCKYCGHKHIDGLVDNCPNCGARKEKGTKCYIDENNTEEVTQEELRDAGIMHDARVEDRPDWLCSFCNTLNNDSYSSCECCGASKKDSEENYFGVKTNNKEEKQKVIEQETYEDRYDKVKYEYSDFKRNTKSYSYTEYDDTRSYENYVKISNTFKKLDLRKIFTFIAAVVATLLLVYGFAPYEVSTTVNGFSWNRSISIEQEKTVHESGWSVPAGAKVYLVKEEKYGTEKVIDHYEEKEVKKTKEEYSHDDISYDYEYEDNGDGTYTKKKIEIRTPVYVEVEYTEVEEVPVYKEVDIMKNKYYYTIDRRYYEYSSNSSGNDKNPYWNTNYTLKDRQFDDKRTESYYIHYDNEDKKKASYNEWMDTQLGDKVTITKCRLGFIYSQAASN